MLALLIASTIAGYTLADKQGIQHAGPIPYLELTLIPATVAALALQLRSSSVADLRAHLGLRTLAAGLASFAAYVCVLEALKLAPAAAVAAVRESGILFVALMGAVFLKEPVGPSRLAGAASIVAGVAFVALG